MTMVRIRISHLAALFVSLAALMVAIPAFAQTTTGQIRGEVLDADDFGIPGVSVILSSENLIGGEQTRTTDVNGRFVFVELPPGSYDIVAKKDGFPTVNATGIQVNIGRTTNQSILMDADVEVVDVEGTRPVVDVEDTSRGQVLTKEFLERIPTGRSYQSAVQMANGVVGGSNPNMAGAAGNENTYMVDGATITDPVTGTFSLNFNYDAIEQIEVLLGGFMPEYGQSLGGIVNLVTDSGTNNLEFDTSVFYTNGNWRRRKDARYTADGFQLGPTDFDTNFQILQVASRVSGPIVRDRAWFIITYQHSRSIIANTGIPLPRDFDGHYIFAKLTVQPNAEHRLTAFVRLDPTSIDNTNQSDVFIRPEAQGRQYQSNVATQARWQWFLGNQANLDTQFVFQKQALEVGGVPCTHATQLGYHPCKPDEDENYVDWVTPGRVGSFGAYDTVNYPSYYFDDRLRYQASSKLSLLSIQDPLGGSHDIKAGIEGVQTIWDQMQGYNSNLLYADLNVTGWDPLTFSNWYRLELTGPIKFRTTGSQWNWFIQDSYKPLSNLVIKGGIRYDNSVMRNDVGDPVIAQSLWGPRLYASWDPFGDQKTKIAGGYGRFNDAGRLGVASYVRESSIGVKYWYGEYHPDGDFASNQGSMLIYQPRENPTVAHDTLRSPRVDEFTLQVQREIIRDVGISTGGSYKMTRFIFEPDEQNIIYDEDGSAIIGSRYGNPNRSFPRMRTPELARRNYLQWDTMLYKVNSRRWFGSATYTYTLSSGTSTQSLSGSFLNDPQTQYNYGPLIQTDIRHVVKAFGSWQLPTDPWNQTLGFTFEYYSGRPLERYYWSDASITGGGGYFLRIRPRGTYTRFPPEWSLGLKFTQDLDVRRGKIKLDVQLLNALNNRAPTNFLASFYQQNRLFTTTRQNPLRVQLGLRYVF